MDIAIWANLTEMNSSRGVVVRAQVGGFWIIMFCRVRILGRFGWVSPDFGLMSQSPTMLPWLQRGFRTFLSSKFSILHISGIKIQNLRKYLNPCRTLRTFVCRLTARFRISGLKRNKTEQIPMGLSGDSPESPKPDHNSAHESPEGLKHSVSELQTFVLLFIDPEALFRTETATRMKQKMHMVDANQISRPMCSM